jgi:hypothetical protein
MGNAGLKNKRQIPSTQHQTSTNFQEQKIKKFSLAEHAEFAEKTREGISSKTMRVYFGIFLSL